MALTRGIKLPLSAATAPGNQAAILAGQVEPEGGQVTAAAGVKINYLPQHPVFSGAESILLELFQGEDPSFQALHRHLQLMGTLAQQPDNMQAAAELAALGQDMDNLGGWELENSGRALLNRLGVENLERTPGVLSGGEKKRVALARALLTPCQLLILDEPTNHLDSKAILWLEEYLTKRSGALILITHDRWLLSRAANRILEIDRGEFLDCAGGYQKYLESKAAQAETAAAAARKHRAALKRELTWMLQGAQGRATKEKARKKMFRELNRQTERPVKGKVELHLTAQRLGKKVIQLESVSKGYPGRPLIDGFSYTLLPRDRLGIVGENGSGKSTLLDLIAGLVPPDSGRVVLGETVKIGYYRQHSQDMREDLRVLQYIEGIRLAVRTARGEELSAGKMLERFLFSGSDQWTYIRDLSGGERRRLYLLGILMEEPNVLLLDEPTNNLDIETLTVLEDYLEDFPGAVLAVSHDRWFLDKTMDHLLALDGMGGIRLFTGSFSEYLKETVPTPPTERPAHHKPPRPKQVKTGLNYREQKEYEELEGEIDRLQSELERLRREQEEAPWDYLRLETIHHEAQTVEVNLEDKMERWLELNQRAERGE